MENQTADTSHDVQSATESLLGLLPDEESENEGEGESQDSAETEESDVESDDADDEEADESDEDEEEAEAEDDSDATPDDEDEGKAEEDAEAKADRLRHADYTRKTQALAEERRAFQAEAERVRNEREEYRQGLELVAQILKQNEPDWDTLRKENPAEYAAAKLEWQENQRVLAEEQAKLNEKQLAEQQEAHAQILAAERQRLETAIPEWSDEEMAKTEKQRLVQYAQSMGYTPDDLASVVDHRAVVMLRKAMLYDEMTTKGKEAVKAKAKKPEAKPLKPGTPQGKKQKNPAKDALKRLARTGNTGDAARAIFEMLPDK